MKRLLIYGTVTAVAAVLYLTGLAVAGEKIKLCHYPPGNPENWRIITVDENAAEGHFAHGDLYPMTFFEDADGDGYGNDTVSIETCKMPVGYVGDNTDCNDAEAESNPGLEEVLGDNIDNDCNQDTSDGPAKFKGVLTNVPKSEMIGWSVCYQATYDTGIDVAEILSKCTKANIMLACSEVGSQEYTVVAHAPRDDVFFNTGNGNAPHHANGVNWYFSQNCSMGFAPEGTDIMRYSCDTESERKEERMCWHTFTWIGGWSCGAKRGLLYDYNWERVVLQAD